MKNRFCWQLWITLVVWCLPSLAYAQFEDIPGLRCDNPVHVTDSFFMNIPFGGSYWFTAETYDLPLHARFTIQGDYRNKPTTAYVDFRCEEGQYTDEKLEDVVTSANGWGIEVPMRFDFDMVYIDSLNITRFDLEISESYRELLASFGITYNVTAYVNIDAPRGGEAAIIPDTAFRSCIEHSHWVSMPDSLNISTSTIDSVFTMPFANWIGDSIRIRWNGDAQDVAIWIGNSCDVSLDISDMSILDHFVIPAKSHKDLSATYIRTLMELNGIGGVYYARFVTGGAGSLIIEPKPIEGPLADAIEMQKNEQCAVAGDDTTQYYFFDTEWRYKPLIFTAVGTSPITAHFGTTPDFYISEEDTRYLGSRLFEADGDGQVLGLSMPELKQYTDACEMGHVFVRFETGSSTMIIPLTWAASTCVGNTTLLPTHAIFDMYSNRAYPKFRIKHDEWAQQDMDFYLNGLTNVYLYIGDTCTFNLTPSNKRVVYYQKFSAKDTLTLSQDTLRSMVNRTDADGYLYLQFLGGQTTGEMHVFPHPTNDPPTSLGTIGNKGETEVIYAGEDWLIKSSHDQQMYLYNSLGTLVSTWYQTEGEQKQITAPQTGIYILRTEQETILLKR